MLCKPYAKVLKTKRPSPRHFRGLVVPPQKNGKVQFLWVEVESDSRLLAHHSAINKWKVDMKDRYKQTASGEDPLVVEALSRDFGLQDKRFGHGLRVVYWPPPSGSLGYREDYNRLAFFSLSRLKGDINIGSLRYGPIIAFAYKLDTNLALEGLDDMTTNDLRHLVDYFRNSHWNPTIGDVKRYPRKAIQAHFIPDTTHVLRDEDKDLPEDPNHMRCAGALAHKIGIYWEGARQMIPADINSEQACFHLLCNKDTTPIPNMCLSGYIWQTFLLGPLMLGLPWVGRNAVIADIHNSGTRHQWPLARWERTKARYLRQGIHTSGRMAFILPLNMTDGLIVFDAYGRKMPWQHLSAYDQFIFQSVRRMGQSRPLTKFEFARFWDDWKKNRVEMAEKEPDPEDATTAEGYRALPSPYDMAPGSSSILSRDMTKMLGCLTELFEDPEFRAEFQQSEMAMFDAELPPIKFYPKNLRPYHHKVPRHMSDYDDDDDDDDDSLEGRESDEPEGYFVTEEDLVPIRHRKVGKAVQGNVSESMDNSANGNDQSGEPSGSGEAMNTQAVDLAALAAAGLNLLDQPNH